MKLDVLLSRLHQLSAVDNNALQIYSDLSRRTQDAELAGVLEKIAKDEKRHFRLEQELIALLQKHSDEQNPQQ